MPRRNAPAEGGAAQIVICLLDPGRVVETRQPSWPRPRYATSPVGAAVRQAGGAVLAEWPSGRGLEGQRRLYFHFGQWLFQRSPKCTRVVAFLLCIAPSACRFITPLVCLPHCIRYSAKLIACHGCQMAYPVKPAFRGVHRSNSARNSVIYQFYRRISGKEIAEYGVSVTRVAGQTPPCQPLSVRGSPLAASKLALCAGSMPTHQMSQTFHLAWGRAGRLSALIHPAA